MRLAKNCARRRSADAPPPLHHRHRCTAAAPLTAHPPAACRRLLAYTGRDISRPLLLAIKGRVLDVAEGEDYYGPEGPYKIMAGRDASKAFAMMSLKAEDAVADVSAVPPEHLKILDDWCGYARMRRALATPRKRRRGVPSCPRHAGTRS